MADAELRLAKACRKCGETKPVEAFYKHNYAKDGLSARCKVCCRADAIANRREKIEYYKAYDRDRANLPKRVEARKSYASTERGKERKAAGSKAWIDRNKEKRSVHIQFSNALKSGIIEKPNVCFVCGSADRRIHGHHFDYSKPLDVLWCCEPCHVGLHKMLRERERDEV